MLTRIHVVIALGATLLAFGASSASAAPEVQHNPSGRILGVVHARGTANRFGGTSSNLQYHNGPVMQGNHTYSIYWIPPSYSGMPSSGPVSANYVSLINGFFNNVAGATGTGTSSDVYYSDTQYSDHGGSLSTYLFGGANSTAVQSTTDTNAFPANGCRDRYTTVCLTDGQLQAEIAQVIHAKGWSAGPGNVFFLFTPRNVGTCYGSSCAFSYFCAYHSSFNSSLVNGGSILYANMPDAAWVPGACGSGQSPNQDDADSTINVTSHEHNESITDPLGTAWYDSRGYEDGDKCAWNFGTALGSAGGSGTQYNQQIGTGRYYLQQEWSNASSGCVLTGT